MEISCSDSLLCCGGESLARCLENTEAYLQLQIVVFIAEFCLREVLHKNVTNAITHSHLHFLFFFMDRAQNLIGFPCLEICLMPWILLG